MELCYDLPVYKDAYHLALKIFDITPLFYREYKYSLGQVMKRADPKGQTSITTGATSG